MRTRCALFTIAIVLFASSFRIAKTAKTAKPAPPPSHIPAQILSAKSVFISYAGIDDPYTSLQVPKFAGGDPNGIYDQFYDAVKNWGRYQLVSAPADADLVLEISVHDTPRVNPILHLRVLDPRSKVELWAFYETLAMSPQGWDKTLGKIVGDLQLIATQIPVASK
ncbi:MAG TPA: hypothetical protein VMD99_00325 [Terriglobales bacterium]|nr:hypothetical protein [Terriglobales bacterium]